MKEGNRLINARQVAGAVRLSIIETQRLGERHPEIKSEVYGLSLMGNVLHHLLVSGPPQLDPQAYIDVIKEAHAVVAEINPLKAPKLI